jgi:hypothetical protein
VCSIETRGLSSSPVTGIPSRVRKEQRFLLPGNGELTILYWLQCTLQAFNSLQAAGLALYVYECI